MHEMFEMYVKLMISGRTAAQSLLCEYNSTI